MNLDKNLKMLLDKRGMSVSHLARMSDVPKQTISDWLTGRKPKSLMSLKRVADTLEVTVDYLCFGEDKPKTAIEEFKNEINAGVFEVVLRRVK